MTADADTDEPEPTALKFVGPATAERLADAAFGAAEIAAREVSFNMLRTAGVNPGVAAKIRREHSLPWSFETEDSDGDLDRRSTQVRGLGDGERAWVAASEGDWDDPANAPDGAATTPTDEDGDGSPTVSFETGESEWPEPATPAGVETADGTGLDGPPTAADRHGDESDDGSTAGVDDGPAADDAGTRADGSLGDTDGTDREAADSTDDAATDASWPDTARPDAVVTVEEADAAGEWPETARPEGVATADDTEGPGADAAWPAVVGGVPTGEAESDESDETERRTNGTAQADGAGAVVDTTTDGPVTDEAAEDESVTADTTTDEPVTDDTTADASIDEGEPADDPVEEPVWRTRSSPTPLSVLDETDEATRRRLATAGITSLRALATADPDAVAGALGLEPERLATLRAAARRYTE